MNVDTERLRQGVTAVSYARSDVHQLASKIQQAIETASQSNQSRRYRKCISNLKEVIDQLGDVAMILTKVGKTLSLLESASSELDK